MRSRITSHFKKGRVWDFYQMGTKNQMQEEGDTSESKMEKTSKSAFWDHFRMVLESWVGKVGLWMQRATENP